MPSTTTNLALRKPLATEAPDGAGQISNLADDIEDRLGRTAAANTALAAGTRIGQRALVTAYSGYTSFGAVEFRWNGSVWKPWDSDWQTWAPDLQGATGSFFTAGRCRFSGGQVEAEMTASWGAGGSTNNALSMSLPHPRDTTQGGSTSVEFTGGWFASGRALNASDSYRNYRLFGSPVNNNYVQWHALDANAQSTSAIGNTNPFGEAFAQNDQLQLSLRYSPG